LDLAGLSPPLAQAILPGLRIDAAKSYVNRIADIQQWDDARRDELKYVFEQLGTINKLRNDILHYGSPTGDSEQ